MHGNGTYLKPVRRRAAYPTRPDPVPDVPRREPPRQAQPVYDSHALDPDVERPKWEA
jgi:hypothetical protein